MEDTMLSVKEIAKMLSVSKRTIQRMVKRGDLDAIRVGGQIRVRRSALDQMLRECSVYPTGYTPTSLV